MARTMFVNPSFVNPRRKARKGKRSYMKRRRFRASGSMTFARRRNAGIAPFVQNPMILSNPRKRRHHKRRNPSLPSVKSAVGTLMTSGGGAALAFGVTTYGVSHVPNKWARYATQAGVGILGGGFLGSKSAGLGGAFTGAMFYPLIQALAVELGVVGASATAKEADLDALAADLEDVLDDMNEDTSGLSDDGDDEEEYAW